MRFDCTRREFLKAAAAGSVWGGICAVPTVFAGDGLPAERPDEWRMFRYDVQNSGVAPGSLPQDLQLLWQHKTPDGVTSTPVIWRGRTYVGTVSGDLHCIDLHSGKINWTYKSVEKVEPNSFAPAFNAPLAMDDELVFAGDDMGRFHAVEVETGKARWTFDTQAEIVGGALPFAGKVLFGSHDNFLYCFEAATGKKLWAVEALGPVNATPTLAGKFTFTTGCDQPILRVIDVEAGKQSKEVPLDALLIASAAYRDGILYFGTDGGTVYALDWTAPQTVWAYSVPDRQQRIQSSPAVTEELVVIGSRDKFLHCIDRQTGQPRWTFPTRAQIDGSPVVVGDRVFFGSGDRTLYGVSLKDGKEVWRYNAGQSITGSPAVAEGKLVVGTDTTGGRILCFGAKG